MATNEIVSDEDIQRRKAVRRAIRQGVRLSDQPKVPKAVKKVFGRSKPSRKR